MDRIIDCLKDYIIEELNTETYNNQIICVDKFVEANIFELIDSMKKFIYTYDNDTVNLFDKIKKECDYNKYEYYINRELIDVGSLDFKYGDIPYDVACEVISKYIYNCLNGFNQYEVETTFDNREIILEKDIFNPVDYLKSYLSEEELEECKVDELYFENYYYEWNNTDEFNPENLNKITVFERQRCYL